jgi:hypothetical protein
MTTFFDGLRISGDRFFNNMGARPIALRLGETLEFAPRPMVLYQGVQPLSEITSQVTDTESYETYSVSVGKEQLKAAFDFDPEKMAAAIGAGVIWYVNHDDQPGWRRCRTVGTPDLSGVADVRFKLVRMAIDEY